MVQDPVQARSKKHEAYRPRNISYNRAIDILDLLTMNARAQLPRARVAPHQPSPCSCTGRQTPSSSSCSRPSSISASRMVTALAIFASGATASSPMRGGAAASRALATTAAARAEFAFESSKQSTLLCSSLTASTKQGMLDEAREAKNAGADVVELRLDFLQDFDPSRDLEEMIKGFELPCIVTYRPSWEGGQYQGDDAPRLAALKLAMEIGAAYVDVEFLIAPVFMAAIRAEADQGKEYTTKIIVSSHDYKATASDVDLRKLVQAIRAVGADVVKFATTGQDVSDGNRVLSIVKEASASGPIIGLCMGEKGQATRILAPKYGGYLTFGALSPERQSAPGQPTIDQLKNLYRLDTQSADTKILGIVGNPVSHSKSPAIHNGALGQSGLTDYVYIPLLVDDFDRFLQSLPDEDWVGLSVTIPHKGAALAAAAEADEVASSIAAANTLVRIGERQGVQGVQHGLAGGDRVDRAGHGGGRHDGGRRRGWRESAGRQDGGRAWARGAPAGRWRSGRRPGAPRSSSRIGLQTKGGGSWPSSCSPAGPGRVAWRTSAAAQVGGDVAVLVNTTSVGMQPNDGESPSSGARDGLLRGGLSTPCTRPCTRSSSGTRRRRAPSW